MNEKLRGASSSNETPQCVHARCSENISVSRSAGLVFARHDLDLGDAFGEAQRGLERVGEPALDARTPHQPVDDHLDGVVLVAGQALAGRRAELFCLPLPGDNHLEGGTKK